MSRQILVRATINLPGLPVGAAAYVDPEDPYIAALLRSGFLHADDSPGEAPAALPAAEAAASDEA